MEEEKELIVKGDFTIEVIRSQDAESPREWSNDFKMVCFHGNYNLGDKHNYSQSDFDGWDELKAEIIKSEDPIMIKPLYLHDHSGISMSFSDLGDRGDSGCVGFIYTTHELLKEGGHEKVPSEKDLKKWLEAEVETYTAYLEGEVFGYNIHYKDEGINESCWGYYGSDHKESGLLDQAEGVIANFKGDEWEAEKKAERIAYLQKQIPRQQKELDQLITQVAE